MRRSSSVTIGALFGLVGVDSNLPLPNNERFAGHLFPLPFLRVAQKGLNLSLAVLAKLYHFGPDFLRISAGLGLFHQGSDLLLHILYPE